eukprot:CAMPEP_0197652552 /NCGR_PEP_ID=MMETSP1338-20131121/34518_1 /TAXON_ID=43686 ORGANISM="Pelagodinium beii, Strain RCC1491" /NCGR_SAMPLE_ID=MMETSP1338 /ASSEMBLY_ACC=CAM_ASM_000754 /LENGTH=465 /DNA_ID=CAMNT_0043227451 /DNA_START=98 /DNA_END=1495 /DNA_ORIENTATION=-
MPEGNPIKAGKVHVIKVGTSTILTNDQNGGEKANLANLARLVEVIAKLKSDGEQVILVSSGAVGMGCLKLGLKERPKGPGAKQAMAAAGQSRLMRLYEDLFQVVNIQVAQMLISREDFSDKLRFTSVRTTMLELLRLGVVPIVNENDSLAATHVAKFGDNDTMAAMLAALIEADWLFLATDVDFLYSGNPKTDASAKPIHMVEDVASLQIGGLDSSSSAWGTGGMATKLVAASIAVCAGCHCGLVNGAEPERIIKVLSGCKDGGTRFVARASPDIKAAVMHGRWILALPLAGTLSLDADGYKSVLGNRNLMAQSIVKVAGSFQEDQAVSLTYNGIEIARALVRCMSTTLDQALRERKSARNLSELPDFSQELQAAGIYLEAYRAWRQGSHKGAKGEMTSDQLREEPGTNAVTRLSVVAWAGDVVRTAVGANESHTAKVGKRARSMSPTTSKNSRSRLMYEASLGV